MALKNPKIGILIIGILHAVGTFGTLIPATSDLTVSLTPINLLISSLILFYHGSRSKETILFLALSYSVGLIVEILGVQTGFPFGSYTYGIILGPKILGAPLIIGINWFMLAFATGSLSHKLSIHPILKAALAASLMTLMDLLIEPVAIALEYWQWEGDSIPLSNYIAWWGISFALQLFFQRLLPKEKTSLAMPLIISQVGYFLSVVIFY